ncbi:MAG TPA: TerC family protein [Myxococcales bacterium]|nr:TerC family protein [Myxococcales bacterium]
MSLVAATDIGARNIESPGLWVAFLAGIVALLLLDLRLASRRHHAQKFGEAVGWSVFWITLSVAFGSYLWSRYGGEQGLEFFAGYLLEKSLSVDNLFVFVILFRTLRVPAEHQHRVLFWGVLGAVVMRGVFILAGVALVKHFQWVIAIFGAVLVYSAAKLALAKDDEEQDPTDNFIVRRARKVIPMTAGIEGPRFLVRRDGAILATPLLLAVIAAEATDLIFALDSIPAVFAVTDDPFLVFSSNICAILGLRALYFVVAGAIGRLTYLKVGLAGILFFIGGKMVLYKWVHLATGVPLAVIGVILAIALIASLLRRPAAERPSSSDAK